MEDLLKTGKKENLDQLDNFSVKFRFWVLGTATTAHRSSYWLVGNHRLPIPWNFVVCFEVCAPHSLYYSVQFLAFIPNILR